MRRVLLLLLARVACAVLRGVRGALPPSSFGWVEVDERLRSGVEREHTLTFWLQGNDEVLFTAAENIASPGSENYRQYLSHEKLQALIGPSHAESAQRTTRWLVSSGVHNIRKGKHGDFLFATATLEKWSNLFDGTFSEYENTHRESSRVFRLSGAAKRAILASEHVAGKAELEGSVRAVFGLSDFFPVVSSSPLKSDCHEFKGDQIDPDVIAAQYKLNYDCESSKDARSQGIAAFEDAQFVQTDVFKFQHDYNLSQVNISVIGPNNGGYYGEASLDTQYIFSTGKGVPTYFIAREAFDMLEWSFLVMNMTSPPSVLSVSWGNGESGFDSDHMHAASREFAKMGTLGISIFAASGDDGTGKQGFWGCKKFDPTWPASSPWVTAVGGTYRTLGKEVGWSSSGGGYSAIFKRPDYQSEAAEGYEKSGVKFPSGSLYNASGRLTPDVSALSTNFRTLSLGAYGCISGTSAATPVFAGLVAKINADLERSGKAPVGFVNPTLYAHHGDIGYDVTAGNNKVQGCPSGFNAAEGFDCVTGLGTPTYESLKSILT